MLWRELHIDNKMSASLIGRDGLNLAERYVNAITGAMRRGEDVPSNIVVDVRKVDSFNKKTDAALESQKRDIAKLLGDANMDTDRLEENMPRILEFLKMASNSLDKKVAAEARSILEALQHRHNPNTGPEQQPEGRGPKP